MNFNDKYRNTGAVWNANYKGVKAAKPLNKPKSNATVNNRQRNWSK